MDNTAEKIYKAGLKFLVPLTLDQTYKLIIDEALKLTKGVHGSILLKEDDELRRVYASDPILYQIQPRKRGFMYNVFKNRTPLILDYKQISKVHPEINLTSTQTDIIVPLSNKNSAIGVISIMFTKSKKELSGEFDALKLFAPLASLAIRKTQLYEEANQALASRDLFISMAAHEFRTPLTTINGYIGLLHSKLAKQDTPEARWVEELSWEGSRMTLLVNELLEVDRIKSGHFRYIWKEVHLKRIINRALMDFRFTHPDYKVTVDNKLINGQDRVIGDYDKLLQVVINLLDNAAKYSPINKNILISLRMELGNLVLSVKDQGHGITKNDLNTIFEKFARGNNHQREGMGLGLFLAKSIIEHHRGEIKLRSKENKGTVIEIRLPKIKHD